MKDKSLYIELYDFLEGFEQIEKDDIYKQVVVEWSEKQVEDFIVNIFGLIPNDSINHYSNYNFYANSTLAGAPYPCSNLDCRMENVASLLRFAALYADKMLTQSPIDKHIEDVEMNRKIDRMNLAGDIIIILNLKPLVLSGIMGFFSSYLCLCDNCLQKISRKEYELKVKIQKISELMYKEASNSINCKLKKDLDGAMYFAIKGAEEFGFHEQIDIIIGDGNEKIKKLLKNSKEVTLTVDMMNNMGIINHLFNPLINDVFQAQINTCFFSSSYLTNRPYEAKMISQIKSIGYSKEIIEHTKMVEAGLFHEVPLLDEVKIEEIINLRKKDGEAFDGYRSKMNAILDTFDKLDQKTIADIQRDIILPELDSMKQAIYRNKQALIKSVAQDILIIGGGIGIGVFSGMLPIDYSSLVGTMGGISAISNIVDKVRQCLCKDEIKSNSFYFLYELQSKYKRK